MANIVNLKEYLRRVFKDLKEYTDGLSPEELEENPRARSAKLRVAEKCETFDI